MGPDVCIIISQGLYALQILHRSKTGELLPFIWACLDDELRHDLRALDRSFKNMGLAAKIKRPLLKCSAVDYVFQTDIPLSLDPDSVALSIVATHSATQETRRSERLNNQKAKCGDTTTASNGNKTKTFPILSMKRSNATKSDSTVFIQQVCSTFMSEASFKIGTVKFDTTTTTTTTTLVIFFSIAAITSA